MFRDGTEFVSPKYTKFDYAALGLTIYSPELDFQKAVAIFQDRINGRFLQQINQLRENCLDNGFAIMALECLLIESLSQFVTGKDDNKNCSAVEYKRFLITQLRFTPKDAGKFYSCIRCGILHQAQTKDYSALVPDGDRAIFYVDGFFMVNVKEFSLMIDRYVDYYCHSLLDDRNTYLRLNFIKKMDYICNR